LAARRRFLFCRRSAGWSLFSFFLLFWLGVLLCRGRFSLLFFLLCLLLFLDFLFLHGGRRGLGGLFCLDLCLTFFQQRQVGRLAGIAEAAFVALDNAGIAARPVLEARAEVFEELAHDAAQVGRYTFVVVGSGRSHGGQAGRTKSRNDESPVVQCQ